MGRRIAQDLTSSVARIAILATGDEITHGDILNTNANHIAHILSTEAMPMGEHLSCSDEPNDLIASLAFLSERHQTIILTGGLGPTSDDNTRFALAAYLHIPLIEFPEAMKHIETRLARTNLSLNPGNVQQAQFPKHAILLPNPNGTAMGCAYQHKDKLYVLLPGPPPECLPMFEQYALPLIRKHHHQPVLPLLKWRLFGVAESQIAQQLEEALSDIPCRTGYRLERPYLEFKVRCEPEQVETIHNIVDKLIEPYCIASVEKKASEKLQDTLVKLNCMVVIDDEATKGTLQTLLQRPNNHTLLCFKAHPEAAWHIHLTGLKEYWQQQEAQTSSITISIKHQGKTIHETHSLPYYNAWILNSASEWIAFKINQHLEESI